MTRPELRTGLLRLLDHVPDDPFATADRLLVERGVLGVGATGAVQLVHDPRLLRQTALKQVHPDAVHPEAWRRFVDEVRVAGQLEHPQVVPVYEAGAADDGSRYAVFKRVDGHTLADAIDALGEDRLDPEPLARAIGALVRVCDALGYAHHRGVTHCDVKPANILLGRFGEVYLSDWGSAIVAGASDVTVHSDDTAEAAGPPGGTPAFLSPEQAAGEVAAIGPHTDVFGVGAVLYYVLCGSPPYGDATPAESTWRALTGDFRPLADLVGGRAPARLVAICERAMARSPADRFPDAAALQRELDQFLRGTWNLPTRRVTAGERVVTEGDAGHCAWVVQRGRLRVWTEHAGHALELRELGPGDVFGEMALLGNGRRSAHVDALTDGDLLEVSADALTEGLGLNGWLGAFVTAMATRFREVDQALRDVRVSEMPEATRRRGPD